MATGTWSCRTLWYGAEGTSWVHSVPKAVPEGLHSTFAGVSQVRIT